MKKSIIAMMTMSLMLMASFSSPIMVKICDAAAEEYSSAMIAELGEAATVLVYTRIVATIKVYVPDINWVPTTEYFLVPVSIAAIGSGFFVTADGYIVTAGHVLFCFTHQDLTRDLYTKYFLMESAFAAIVQELENKGYYLTPDVQTTLWNYIMTYGEIRDSLRQVFAVLGEVAPTLTDVPK